MDSNTGDLVVNLKDKSGVEQTLVVKGHQEDTLDTLRVDHSTGPDIRDGLLEVYTVALAASALSDDNTILFGVSRMEMISAVVEEMIWL